MALQPKKPIPDVIGLKRTQPVQGRPVFVKVCWNEEQVGELTLPFAAWIKFNRLLSHGVAQDKKEEGKLNVKVKVEGLEEVTPRQIAIQQHHERKLAEQQPQQPVYRGGISNLAAEEEDEDIKAAERQAVIDAATPPSEALAQPEAASANINDQLVRSLRPEEGE